VELNWFSSCCGFSCYAFVFWLAVRDTFQDRVRCLHLLQDLFPAKGRNFLKETHRSKWLSIFDFFVEALRELGDSAHHSLMNLLPGAGHDSVPVKCHDSWER